MSGIEEFHGSDVEILADIEKFTHGKEGFTGRNIVYVAPAVSQVIT